MLIFGLVWLASAFIGAAIGEHKGRRSLGCLLGFLLGPLGWAIILCTSDCRRKCPECGGAIPENVRKCMHCGSELYSLNNRTGPASVGGLDSTGRKIVIRKR